MSLVQWDPWKDMEKMFDSNWPALRSGGAGWDLAVDVLEEGSDVIAKMNIPGVNPDKIDIYAEEDLLTVSGSREEEHETKEKHYYSREIRSGSFQRSVRLPVPVKGDMAKADYHKGVLTITLPKRNGSGERKHKIAVSSS